MSHRGGARDGPPVSVAWTEEGVRACGFDNVQRGPSHVRCPDRSLEVGWRTKRRAGDVMQHRMGLQRPAPAPELCGLLRLWNVT